MFSRCNTTCKPGTKIRGHVPKADNHDEYFYVEWDLLPLSHPRIVPISQA